MSVPIRAIALLGWLLLGGSAGARADVQLGATRVVYPEALREASLAIRNLSSNGQTYLLQSWVHDEQERPSSMAVFPPLFRLEPGSAKFIRLISVDTHAPRDRESLYWLTVKAIPSSPAQPSNLLQAVVSHKLKVFYRPSALPRPTVEPYKSLRFSLAAPGRLRVVNPSPFYISFFSLAVDGVDIPAASLLAPFATAEFPLPQPGARAVLWQVIDEYGAVSAPERRGLP